MRRMYCRPVMAGGDKAFFGERRNSASCAIKRALRGNRHNDNVSSNMRASYCLLYLSGGAAESDAIISVYKYSKAQPLKQFLESVVTTKASIGTACGVSSALRVNGKLIFAVDSRCYKQIK